MAFSGYLGILLRRWWIVAGIILLDVLVSLYLYRKDTRALGAQSCLTVYVADLSSPGLISAPPTTLQAEGELLAGETAANFFGDDILDISRSRSVLQYMQRHAPSGQSQPTAFGVSGSRLDRTVNLCVNAPLASQAQDGANALSRAITVDRAQFIGTAMAKRWYVHVISAPLTSPAPPSHARRDLLLRIALGVLVALGAAFLWDAVDRPAAAGGAST